MGGCVDESFLVRMGEPAVFDVRVMFQNGGTCSNQGVRLLRISKDSQPGFVYVCSNLMGFEGPCNNNNNPRFTVMNAATSCTQDCKYNIDLQLTDFNESDAGVYTVEVIFQSIGDTMQRTISRRFSFMLANDSGM